MCVHKNDVAALDIHTILMNEYQLSRPMYIAKQAITQVARQCIDLRIYLMSRWFYFIHWNKYKYTVLIDFTMAMRLGTVRASVRNSLFFFFFFILQIISWWSIDVLFCLFGASDKRANIEYLRPKGGQSTYVFLSINIYVWSCMYARFWIGSDQSICIAFPSLPCFFPFINADKKNSTKKHFHRINK